LGGVAVTDTLKNETYGKVDLKATIQIYWDLVDELKANQRGDTGNFVGLMADYIRSYFNDSSQRIQFAVEKCEVDAANTHTLAFAAISIFVVLMNL